MRFASIMALLLAASAPVAAQLPDPMTMTTDPADRAVMAEVAAVIASRSPTITQLDAVLAKLPRPTPLRGMVQTVRAAVLGNAKDAGPAVAAIDEALRLLPDDPRPKLVATSIYTFAGSPQRAADLWMQASRESPDIARMSERYIMMALVGRLTDIGDRARADRLSARLNEIGFSSGLAPERSFAALARVRESLRAQQQDQASAEITAVTDPQDLMALYVDRRYTALWPRIAEWAGPGLGAQSLRYLTELRGEWTAADDFETATPYARRLVAMEAYPAVVTLFLPMFDRVTSEAYPSGAEFLAPIVARSLARTGRQAEGRALLAKVAAAMPSEDQGNALNIDGSYITLAAADADWPEVLTRADAFLARGKAFGSNINGSALIEVQGWRACALSRMGRTADAQRVIAEVALAGALAPGPVTSMHICRGDGAAAQAVVLARLEDENTRTWALRFVQPVRNDAATPLDRLMQPVAQQVRTAPAVVAAANRVGRILPQPVEPTLPAGFDPFRAQPGAKPRSPGAV